MRSMSAIDQQFALVQHGRQRGRDPWPPALPGPIQPPARRGGGTLGPDQRVVERHLLDHPALKSDEGQFGAVTLIQRFGSAANLDIHLHCLVLDGVSRSDIHGGPVFTKESAPTDQEACTLRPLQAPAITYRIAFGPRAGPQRAGHGPTRAAPRRALPPLRQAADVQRQAVKAQLARPCAVLWRRARGVTAIRRYGRVLQALSRLPARSACPAPAGWQRSCERSCRLPVQSAGPRRARRRRPPWTAA